MRRSNYLTAIIIIILVLASSCQSDFENNTGYLRLEIETNAFVNPQTKVASDYNPKQIAIQIVDATNNIIEETDDWETWSGKQLRLKPGVYTIKASSNGFDGIESGFDIPYYAGSEQITIESGKEKTVNITCTLANVKVTVNFDQSFVDAFQSAKVTVSSKLANIGTLDFNMGTFYKSAYFPVGNLSAMVSVINKSGKQFSQTNTITNVKARDHYILNYKIADSGSMGGVNVTVDDSQTIYTFTFNVSTEASTQLTVKEANAWSTFAYLEGEIASAKGEVDPTKMTFEYKMKDAEIWSPIVAVNENKKFKATLTGLIPGSDYCYRLVYKNGSEEYASEPTYFITETQNKIPNLKFDDWYSTGKKATYYPCKESDYGSKFWDSGNEGSNTLSSINPTSMESTDVVAGNAAKLSSKIVDAGIMKVFAAGSIYTGDFIKAVVSLSNPGAQLSFGQPFTERPTQLTGYYKYNPGNVDNTSAKIPNVKSGDRDHCSIYIALTDWSTPFIANTQTSTFIDFTDTSIIAYGELSSDMTAPESMSDYEKFAIDLKYRSLTRKPTHILIVCSSSQYGDYFVGSSNSVLLIDEFDFIYGEPTVDPNYIK